MLKPQEIAEISLVLWYLPLEKLAAIKETVLALKEECGYTEPTDDSDEWTREDEIDFARASMSRMEAEDPWPQEGSCEEKKDVKAG